jgi:ribose transport system permease protein
MTGRTPDGTTSPPDPPEPARDRAVRVRLLRRPSGAPNGALAGLVLVGAAMAVAEPVFLVPTNLVNVGVQAAVVALLAIGMTFAVLTGGIDLSVGSVMALGAVVAALVAETVAGSAPAGGSGWAPAAAVVAGLLTGLVAGTGNGLLVAHAGFPPFIATLGTLSLARGLTLVLSDGSGLAVPAAVTALGGEVALGGVAVPVPVLVPAGAALAAAFVLGRTRYGRWTYAVGGNASAAARLGIPVRRVTCTAYVISGLCAATAGLVLAGRLSSAQPRAGIGIELDAVSAVVLGGASLAGGHGTVSGAVTGAVLLAVVRNGLTLLDVDAFWQEVAIGAVLLLAVGVDQARHRGLPRSRRRRRRRHPRHPTTEGHP